MVSMIRSAFLFVAVLITVNAKAQKMTEQEVTALIEGGSYFFRAQQMFPTGAKSRIINEINYTLKVQPAELNADLPYVGRAYQAPANPTDVGVRFTSTDFTVERKTSKKGNLEIKFIPKDQADVRECLLTVYKNGNANLMFTFNQRQNISYQGVVLPLSEMK
jgi:Domain of unknown function (DUF4251)